VTLVASLTTKSSPASICTTLDAGRDPTAIRLDGVPVEKKNGAAAARAHNRAPNRSPTTAAAAETRTPTDRPSRQAQPRATALQSAATLRHDPRHHPAHPSSAFSPLNTTAPQPQHLRRRRAPPPSDRNLHTRGPSALQGSAALARTGNRDQNTHRRDAAPRARPSREDGANRSRGSRETRECYFGLLLRLSIGGCGTPITGSE
jgi:hypothetical protein